MAALPSLRDYQQDLAERLRRADGVATAAKLGVRVGGETWLIDLADAGEVMPAPAVTPVPLTRPWFSGLVNVRGNLLGVIDFSAFLNGRPTSLGPEARLVVLAERFRFGAALLVDRSLGLRTAAQLRRASAGSRPWQRGVYEDGEGRQWAELDMAALVAYPEFLNVAA